VFYVLTYFALIDKTDGDASDKFWAFLNLPM
jgi:hypothetical protein